MALMKAKEVPAGAVVLDEIEATKYAWDVVSDWENLSDVWALKYGPVALGCINAVSGMIINNFYRRKMNLGSYGYIATVVPITLMPATLTVLFHRHLISTDMLLMKNDACPICYEVRSAGIQLGLGLVYPMILGPISTLMLANRYSTARIPDLLEGPRVMFKFLRKTTRPFTGTLTFIAIGQFIASSVVTYYEARNTFAIRRKTMEIEAKLERAMES